MADKTSDKMDKKRRNERRDKSPESVAEDRKRLKNVDPYVNIGMTIVRWNEYKEKLQVHSDEKLAETLLDRLSQYSVTSASADLKNSHTGTSSPDVEFNDFADSESNCVPKETNPLIYNCERYADDFEEMEILGKGGFGKVYKSKNRLDGIIYAVKKIKFTNSEPEDLQKVQREVTALAKLKHTNIVRYNTSWLAYDKRNSLQTISGTNLVSMQSDDEENDWDSSANNGGIFAGLQSDNGNVQAMRKNSSTPKNLKKAVILYIQMELCSKTLMGWMDVRTEVKFTDNMSICKQLLKAVDCMHCGGVIHRDLKPTNIFLLEGLHIKVGDFGLAKEDLASAIAASPAHSESSPALSTTGSVQSDHTSGIGTEIYAAPEQLEKSCYDFKCDIYSLGIIFFELFNIFGTDMERHKILKEFRKGNVPDKLHNDWPEQIDLITHMTSESPIERPSAVEILSGELFSEIDIPKASSIATTDLAEVEELRKKVEQLQLELKQKDELLKQKDRALSRLNSIETESGIS